MKLTFKAGTFYVDCGIADNDLPRRAGFAYDKEQRLWATPFAGTAAKIAKLADPVTKTYIEAHLSREAKEIEASKATGSSFQPPAPRGQTYKPFQRAGIEYLSRRSSALLGDEPGLGKTIQAIGACNLYGVKTALVVCPASLKLNWAREWKTWSTLGLGVGIASGKSWPDTAVVIINYDVLSKHRERLRARTWGAVILDEAHYLKNPKSRRSIEIFGQFPVIAPLNAAKKLALSGTPIPNGRPIEVYPLLRYLVPFGFPDKMRFARHFCDAVQGPFGWDFNGASNLEELQNLMRASIMVRRLKADVLHDLPPKVRQIIEIEPDRGARKLLERSKALWEKIINMVGVSDPEAMTDDEYREVVKAMQGGAAVGFEEVSRIRHEAAVAKIPMAIEHLENAVESSGKVVAFAHHKEVIAGIREKFGTRCVVIDGSTPVEKRQGLVDRFQRDPAVGLFLGEILAAGTGLTLTASSHVVMVELDWVPGNVTQAEDRCHRIGQRNSVLVQHLVLADSLESRMAKQVVMKQETLKEALDYSVDEEIAALLK